MGRRDGRIRMMNRTGSFLKPGLAFLCVILLLPQPSSAGEIDRALFEGYEAALVIYDRGSRETVDLDPSLGSRRLPPCSTFKIYNTLIGLELGLLRDPDGPWYAWDGTRREIDEWNQDLTLREAFRVSAVPAFQALAREIGAVRMETFIKKIRYGTQDISAGVDVFWLPRTGATPIMISAREQVIILNELLDADLPFSKKNFEVLRDLMEVVRTDKGALYGKTGSGTGLDGRSRLGWFVGFLESRGTTYVFACNIVDAEKSSGKVARGIVDQLFRSWGAL